MKYFTLFAVIAVMSFYSFVAADEYLIKPGDTLNLIVLGETDFTRHVIVSPQGSITLPLINDVKVTGMTTMQAAQEITTQLKRFMKNPQVTVELLEAGKMQVTVSGEVKNPGVVALPYGARLIDSIMAAGGYTPTADLSKVKVSRPGSESSATVDLSKFLLSGDASTNITVSMGDTIFVPSSEGTIGSILVLGAVLQAGPRPLTQGMTVREAVMAAGGPTPLADLNNITLRHEGSTDTTVIDYSKITSGDVAANPQLKPGDVIMIAARELMGTYTIQGAVGLPAKYDLKGKTTITEAIAVAGGVRGKAKLNDVRILRSSGGQTQTLTAKVSDIYSGKSPNIELQDQDNIYVPEAGQKTDFMKVLSVAVSLGWLLTRGR
ncbi:MAG TPA: polysaccharide biosynthesis/export family protein [Armatimonadota bacterium]|nr:polysaccharide biosynthesis/export family protein [Armatimonadota bacterium]